jgi:ribosomal protein S18 acetylase RimI-like enzyme
MSLNFRPAVAADAEAAVPLILSSGPAAFDYVFAVPGKATASEFLLRAFRDGAGEFGWRNHVVAERDGQVVAAGAGWSGEAGLVFTLAAARQILGCYGLFAGLGVIGRGLRCEGVIPPPPRRVFYLAHLGVRPELRSQGIGATLIAHLIGIGKARGFKTAALDVSVENPRGQALYERLGFRVVRERKSTIDTPRGRVADHRYMEKPI